METKITPNQKNPNYYNVINATPAMITEAAKLVSGNWAKITGSSIVIHKNFVSKLQNILDAVQRSSAVLTQDIIDDEDATTSFVDNNINSGKVANYLLSSPSVQRVLRSYVGKSASEIEKAFAWTGA